MLKGVSVMLGKVIGIRDVKKLRAILLLEADFNALHETIFNSRLIPSLEHSKEIPIEIIGRRRTQAEICLALNNKLISDITNIRKLLAVAICVDPADYYDRVAHPFAGLSAQYFRLEVPYLLVLFKAI